MTKRKPYTEEQIAELPCYKCGKKSTFQWNACADGNIWRPLCKACDVALNVLVVQFLDPEGWVAKLKAYCRRIGHRWSPPK